MTEPMHYRGVERRKYQRFKVAIPVNIGLIAPNREETPWALFRGVTTDISMQGLGLELRYPASGMFPSETRTVGENKEFDLHLSAEAGMQGISSIGEVRWISTRSVSGLKMGVFLKEMGNGEKKKWRDFVMSQSRGSPQDVS